MKTLIQFEKTIDEMLKLRGKSEAELCDAISEGKWSVREIVGHLFYWDKFNLEEMVPKMKDGADLPSFPNHDKHNAEAILFLKDDTVESIIDKFVGTRKSLVEKLSSLEDEVRFTIGGSKRQFSRDSFVKIFLKHDIHHVKQINDKIHS